MNDLITHPAGDYQFLSGIAPYSSGVIASQGHQIVHIRFRRPPPYRVGLKHVESLISGLGRPLQSLCAVELRCPVPYSFQGFAAFNAQYSDLLAQMGLLVDGKNPIARTNIAPAGTRLDEPLLYACSYTVPSVETSVSTFVVAGAGDLDDQTALLPSAIVRRGETSPDAMHAKAQCVLDVMEERLRGLGVDWLSVTATNVYTVHPVHSLIDSTLSPRGAFRGIHGINWCYGRPPIEELEFEMDLRGYGKEEWID